MTKQDFIKSLNAVPCQEGLDCFLSHEGSIEDYFNNHERGIIDFLWCVKHGLDESYITQELIEKAIKKYPVAVWIIYRSLLDIDQMNRCYNLYKRWKDSLFEKASRHLN